MRKLILSLLCLIQIAAFADDVWESRSKAQESLSSPLIEKPLESVALPLDEANDSKVQLPHGFRMVLLILGASAVGGTFYAAWQSRRQMAH